MSNCTEAQQALLTNTTDVRIFWCLNLDQLPEFEQPVKTHPLGVQICRQVWMNKNLDVDKYRNGDPIPKVTDTAVWKRLTTGAYCYYMNDSARYAKTYGKLYNWYAVNDPRGLAPEGWHIPGIEEWVTLENCLAASHANAGALKFTGTGFWASPNTGGTDSTNFRALPGGFRDFNGNFFFVKNYGYWWSSTEYYTFYAWARSLYYYDVKLARDGFKKQNGFSVRCVLDQPSLNR